MALQDWANGALGGTPLNADRLNSRDALLEAALMHFGADPEMLFAGAITHDANGAAISAVVQWPDGYSGTYSGTASVSFPGAVSAYTITWNGPPATKTVTQPGVTRDATTGLITNRPPITVT